MLKPVLINLRDCAETCFAEGEEEILGRVSLGFVDIQKPRGGNSVIILVLCIKSILQLRIRIPGRCDY